MARSYGLLKVHKPGAHLHPIISLRSTPTLGLSHWLYQRHCFLKKNPRLQRLVSRSCPQRFWATYVLSRMSDIQAFKALLNSVPPGIRSIMDSCTRYGRQWKR
uniref:Uncharacterized protein n=1 Tax=Schistocephalus solidus TaxID=70667 RepID=A0A0X3NSZ1_SCHSO